MEIQQVNQQLLQKVPRFQMLPDALLLVLIHSLISRIYLPNEIVLMISRYCGGHIFECKICNEEYFSNKKSEFEMYGVTFSCLTCKNEFCVRNRMLTCECEYDHDKFCKECGVGDCEHEDRDAMFDDIDIDSDYWRHGDWADDSPF